MDSRKNKASIWRPYEIRMGDVDCLNQSCTIKCAIPDDPVVVEPLRLRVYNLHFEEGVDMTNTLIRRQNIDGPTLKAAFIKIYRLDEIPRTKNNPIVLRKSICKVGGCNCFFDRPLNGTFINNDWARINIYWEVTSEPTDLSEFREFDLFQNVHQMPYDDLKALSPEYFKLIDTNGAGPFKVQIRRRFEARIKFRAKLYDYSGMCRSVI